MLSRPTPISRGEYVRAVESRNDRGGGSSGTAVRQSVTQGCTGIAVCDATRSTPITGAVSADGINPFGTPVPFWGQFTYNLSTLSPHMGVRY